ncbi:response regulator [Sulfuricurvum sp.]|uniref:response regulator n=1 Tax=Sulfuricurvum sp. TaxID=2025608 RepID=UPI003C5F62ED
MGNIRLLIVDDVEDNRLVLKAICRKIEGFEIAEAEDGLEAVAKTASWSPHIILMDVMMPQMDGFEASKIIKSNYPETIIMAVTAVMDTQMEEKMTSIGVAAYIRKPIDKDLIRFKLENFAALLRAKKGKFKRLSKKEALNPFCADIRHFKTVFDICDSDAMMDFGMWVLARCEEKWATSCTKVDGVIELYYELMRQGKRNAEPLSIIIEESFEEIFVTIKFEKRVELKPKATTLIQELGADCIVQENLVCVRLGMSKEVVNAPQKRAVLEAKTALPVIETPAPPSAMAVHEVIKELKETRIVHSEEKEMLRQSFVHKTTAIEYVRDIGGDVLDEIRDLESLNEEWEEKLRILEEEHTVQNLRNFVDGALGVYVHAINNLVEFTALGYALSSLGAFLKENAKAIIDDPVTLKKTVMLMEHLGSDLVSWREHIFNLQDTADIHYLDSSFFSSCMQIEGIIGNKELEVEDDNDMEFF